MYNLISTTLIKWLWRIFVRYYFSSVSGNLFFLFVELRNTESYRIMHTLSAKSSCTIFCIIYWNSPEKASLFARQRIKMSSILIFGRNILHMCHIFWKKNCSSVYCFSGLIGYGAFLYTFLKQNWRTLN